MGDDTLDTIIKITDGAELVLKRIQRIAIGKAEDDVAGQFLGPIFSIPNKVAGLGPIALRELGQQPGDEPLDFLEELQQAFDTDPLGPGVQFDIVRGDDTATDGGPRPPEGETLSTGEYDP